MICPIGKNTRETVLNAFQANNLISESQTTDGAFYVLKPDEFDQANKELNDRVFQAYGIQNTFFTRTGNIARFSSVFANLVDVAYQRAPKESLIPTFSGVMDLYRVNRDKFGLNRVQAFASAVVMDRMVGTMASRAGISKQEMYGRLDFQDKAVFDAVKANPLFQLNAWHGSPHSFDRFSTTAIGTGEGAQAFGWGLYFTDLEGIARNYASNERTIEQHLNKVYPFGAPDRFYQIPEVKRNDKDSLLKYIDTQIEGFKGVPFQQQEWKKLKDAIESFDAKLYKVTINKGKKTYQVAPIRNSKGQWNIYTSEDWNKISSMNKSESQGVLDDGRVKPIKSFGSKEEATQWVSENNEYNWLEWDRIVPQNDIVKINKALEQKGILGEQVQAGMTGEQVYNELVSIASRNRFSFDKKLHLAEPAKITSLLLTEIGIDGVKYPAESIAGGRTSDNARGFNYVVFDESAVTIEEKILFQQGSGTFEGPSGEDNFNRWKGENKEVSGPEVQDVKTGQPVVVRAYHGTTNEFYEFDSSVKGNIEGHLGKVNYFTTEYYDAEQNYLAEGADLTSRVDKRQDQIESQLEGDYTDSNGNLRIPDVKRDFGITNEDLRNLYPSGVPKLIKPDELSRFIAERELKGSEERVLDVFVKLNNPVVLGSGATYFETLNVSEEDLDQAAEEIADENGISVEEAKEDYEWDIRERAIENTGYGNLAVEALEKALRDNGYDTDMVSDILGDDFYGTEIDLNAFEQKLRQAEIYENEEGELASSQVIADFFQNLGFDGIILTDVKRRFPGMHLSGGTSHVHVFDRYANQVKLADGTNVTFGETRDIRYQDQTGQTGQTGQVDPKGAVMVSSDGQAIIYALTNPDVSTPLHELAHVYEHYLTDDERSTVVEAAGTKGWTRETSEYFARGFEKYLSEGNAPIPALVGLFEKFKQWFTEIYRGVTGSDIDIVLSDKMREIYDNMFKSTVFPDISPLKQELRLDSLNMTGNVFAGYSAQEIDRLPLGPNITTLSETAGLSPDSDVTVYRGVPSNVSSIQSGDYVTTNKRLAQDYAGTGKVISMTVKAKEILDDRSEPLGEEYILRLGSSPNRVREEVLFQQPKMEDPGYHGGNLQEKSDYLTRQYYGDQPFTGYYFFSDSERAEARGNRSQPQNSQVSVVDFSKYNLLKPTTVGYWNMKSSLKKIVDLLSKGNSMSEILSKYQFDMGPKKLGSYALYNKLQEVASEVDAEYKKFSELIQTDFGRVERFETTILKVAGYEGVDVRGLKEAAGLKSPDAATEGSVIFDLKPGTYTTPNSNNQTDVASSPGLPDLTIPSGWQNPC